MVSQAELTRRHTALRAAMQDAGYDALLIAGTTDSNHIGYIRYVADYRLFNGNAYILFPRDTDAIFVMTRGSQAFWARTQSAVPDVRPAQDKVGEVIRAIQERRLGRARLGVVGLSQAVPYGDGLALKAAFPDAQFHDATRLMEGVMMALSDEELALAEATHGYVVQAMAAVEAALAPGKTEREVMAEAIQTAYRLGCLTGIAHLSTGPAGSIRPPSDQRFQPDDVVKVFLEFCGPFGFWIELGGIFSFKDPAEAKRRKFETAVRAVEQARRLMRPGVKAEALSLAIEDTYRADGWKIAGRTLWDVHGQGLNSLMPPIAWPGSEDVLTDRIILNIHPGIATEDGWGVSITNNFVVTPTGGRALGGYVHEWKVLKR